MFLTGEDGFEIFVPEKHAVALWQMLIDQGEVMPSGLGARDTLRLEAGLCLYGHDIDDTTTPSSAGLSWTVGKSRREAGAAPFPGSEKILAEVAEPKTVRKVRTGLVPKGAPAREGAEICLEDGTIIGKVCLYLVHAHHCRLSVSFLSISVRARGTRAFGYLRTHSEFSLAPIWNFSARICFPRSSGRYVMGLVIWRR